MKKVVYVISILIALSSCNKKSKNQEASIEQSSNENKISANVANGDITEMTFDKMEHDFGIINHSEKVNYSFKFTNTGDNDLIIFKALGSCGCTVPMYPKKPIKPGKTGEIKVTFNSEGKSGDQHKTVTLLVNTKKETEQLHIRASIKGEKNKK